MSHYMTSEQSSRYQANTQTFNMLGAGSVPAKTKCYACGKHKTTVSGKTTAKGRFLCHACKRV